MSVTVHDRYEEPAQGNGSGPDLRVKPRLPNECYEKSVLWTLLFLSYAVSAYVLPAAAIYWVVAQSGWSAPPQILSVICLGILSQQGLHLLGWVGHEGFHSNLHKNRHVSAVIGIVFSSMVGTFMQIGAAISHWNHHRFANREGDPDIAIFTRYRSLWQRMLFARMAANRQYLRNAIRLALRRPVAYATRLPFEVKCKCSRA
jgi:fatty acid desaturase